MRSKTWEQESDLAYVPQYVSPDFLRTMAGSLHYSRILPITNPTKDVLIRSVNKMGRQLEALGMKSEHPYENNFNTALTFTSKIMEEPNPP